MKAKTYCVIICWLSPLVQLAWGEEVRENFASKKEFPSGPGIASEFKADVGLQKKEGVIFADGFESGNFVAWDDKDEEKKNVFTFP